MRYQFTRVMTVKFTEIIFGIVKIGWGMLVSIKMPSLLLIFENQVEEQHKETYVNLVSVSQYM